MRYSPRIKRHAHTGGIIRWRTKHAFVWACPIRELLPAGLRGRSCDDLVLGRACLNRRDQVSGVLVWGNRWEQEYQLAACWIFRFLVGDVLVSERVIWQWFGSDCYQPICEGAWEKAKRFDLGRERKKTGLCDWRGFWEHILAHGRGR